MEKCRKHPRYTGKRKPRPTGLYPDGCPKCWEIHKEFHRPPTPNEKKLANLKPAKKGEVRNPLGINQSQTVHEYARKKLKNGKELVDRLDKISKGQKAGSSVKDEMAASQLLYKIIKDDEVTDKPQYVRVIVLNVKDATFEEYQRGQNTS